MGAESNISIELGTKVDWATVEAVITRADGTVEHLGVIARTETFGAWIRRMLAKVKEYVS